MLEQILSWDTILFRTVNSHRNIFFDWFFSFFSAHITIGIIVTLITFYVMWGKKWKYWYIYILVIALCFLLADRISVVCFKDVFCRLRPSHALDDAVTVKLKHYHYLIYDYKGGLYGFVSSHATNLFSIITSMILIMKNEKVKIFNILLILWGIISGYSRVYCGYHYPGDVICGTLVGIILGFIIFYIYKLVYKFFEKNLYNRKKL